MSVVSTSQSHSLSTKPDCKLLGKDGNIFNLMALAEQTLNKNGLNSSAKEMRSQIEACGDYYKALVIIGEYVNIV